MMEATDRWLAANPFRADELVSVEEFYIGPVEWGQRYRIAQYDRGNCYWFQNMDTNEISRVESKFKSQQYSSEPSKGWIVFAAVILFMIFPPAGVIYALAKLGGVKWL